MPLFLARLLARFLPSPAPQMEDIASPVVANGIDMGAIRTDSFTNDLSGFGTAYDKGSSASITMDRPRLVETEIDALCRNCGIARRIVWLTVEMATMQGWWVRDQSLETDPFANEDRRLHIQARVREGAGLGQKYGAAYTFIDCDEEPPPGFTGDWWALQVLPLDPKRIVRIRNLINFDSLQCTQRTWDSDDTSPNYGYPETYTLSSNVAMSKIAGMPVHWTRLIRWRGIDTSPRERLQYRGIDLSILQSALDSIRRSVTIGQASSNFVQEMGTPIIRSPDLEAQSAGDKSALYEATMRMMARTKSILNVILLGANDVYDRSSPSITGFADLSQHDKERLCADTGYTQSELFMDSRTGLGNQDKTGESVGITRATAFQQSHMLDQLRHLYYLLYCQKDGPTRGKVPESWDIAFHPIRALSPQELAEVQKKTAEADKIYREMGVLSPERIARSRFGKTGWKQAIQPPTTEAAAPSQAAPDSQTPDGERDGIVTDSALPTITLEYQPGEIRTGVSEDGTVWESQPLLAGYGYFEGIPGLDGDEADVLQAGPWSGTTFIVEHRFPDGSLDEYKAVVGVKTPGEALNLYSLTYGPAVNYGRVHAVPDADVQAWLESHLSEDPGPERTDAAPEKYAHINFVPPVGVADEARKALQWRREHGRGGTGVGVARARDLSNRATLSPQTVRRMARYFTRHQGDRRGKGYTPGPGFPSAGRVAWGLWGGDAGWAWARKVVAQMEAADKR